MPEGVKSIGEGAFSGCSGLTDVTLPEGVRNIDGFAFIECYNLSSITLPDSLESIGENAFLACDSLAEVTLGTGLTEFPGSSFDYFSLTRIKAPSSLQESAIKSGVDLSLIEWY